MRRLYDDDDAIQFGWCADCHRQDGSHDHGCPNDPMLAELDEECALYEQHQAHKEATP